MNFHIFICYTFFLVFGAVKSYSSLITESERGRNILRHINEWKNGADHINSLRVPRLSSTLYVKGLQKHFNELMVQGDFSVGYVEVKELNEFNVNWIDTETTNYDLSISLKISIPSLELVADRYVFDVSGWLGMLDSAGYMSVTLQDISAYLRVRFVNNYGSTSIKVSLTSHKINKAKIYLQNCHKLVEEQVISKGVDLFNDYDFKYKVNEALQEHADSFANQYLSDVTFQQLLDSIANN